MKKIVSTLNMEKQEWLNYRKQGIGGSDAGAVCGLNPYKTAMEVYQDKVSLETEEFDNEAMRQGRDFEDYVARRFTEITGKKVRRANAMFCHEEYPFMLADVDRMVVGEKAGLECKTASPFLADKWKDGQIPMHYYIQCLHYMTVCDADAWYLAVLIFGRDFKYYRIERDETMVADLIRIERDFWENHVLAGKFPTPDGSKIAASAILEFYRESEEGKSVSLTGFEDRLRQRQRLTEQVEKLEQEKRQIEQEIKLYMGEAELAENEEFRVLWKSVYSSRLDEKRLKAEQPEVYEKYKKTISSRRFQIKAA